MTLQSCFYATFLYYEVREKTFMCKTFSLCAITVKWMQVRKNRMLFLHAFPSCFSWITSHFRGKSVWKWLSSPPVGKTSDQKVKITFEKKLSKARGYKRGQEKPKCIINFFIKKAFIVFYKICLHLFLLLFTFFFWE